MLYNLDDQPLTAYERAWDAKIARNHRKMEELSIRVGPKPVSPMTKKSSTKGRNSEDFEYIPELREVVEGFDVQMKQIQI